MCEINLRNTDRNFFGNSYLGEREIQEMCY